MRRRGAEAFLSFSVAGASSFLSPPCSAMRCGAWKCNTWSPVRGALCLSSSLCTSLQRRYAVCITNRDMNPYVGVGAMCFCKAPLWNRQLDLDTTSVGSDTDFGQIWLILLGSTKRPMPLAIAPRHQRKTSACGIPRAHALRRLVVYCCWQLIFFSLDEGTPPWARIGLE